MLAYIEILKQDAEKYYMIRLFAYMIGGGKKVPEMPDIMKE